MVLSLHAPSKLQQNLNVFVCTVEHPMCPISTSAGYRFEHIYSSEAGRKTFV